MDNFTIGQRVNFANVIEMTEIKPGYFVPQNEVRYNRHGIVMLTPEDIKNAFKDKRFEHSGPFKDREFWV